MQCTDALAVSKQRIFLLDANRLAVLLENILQTRDRRVILNQAHTRCDRNNDGNRERQVALTALFASRQRAAVRVQSPQSADEVKRLVTNLVLTN